MSATYQHNIVPTVMPRESSGRGLFGTIADALFGKRDPHADAVREMQRHGGGFRLTARLVSYVMLIAFSAQGVMAQVSTDALAVFASIQHGHWPDINKALTVFVVVTFVLGCDLTIIAMAEIIRHRMIQGARLRELWWQLLLVIVPGAIESGTYVKMIVETEPPRTLFDWVLLIARAAFLPVFVVVLATLRAMPFTHKDYQQAQAVRLSMHVTDYINHILNKIDPRHIDGGALIGAFASTTDLTPEQAAVMQHHAESISALVPDNANARIQAEKDAIMREAEERVRAAEEWAKGQLQESEKHLYEALIHLAQGKPVPDHIVDQYPLLASVTLPTNRAPRTPKPPTPRAPKTRADAYRMFLDELQIAPAKAPDGSRKVWVKSGDVPLLARGKPTQDQLRKLVRECGNGAVDGTSLIAPIDLLMRELSERNLVREAAASVWNKYIPLSAASDDDSDDDLGYIADTSDDDSLQERVA